MESFDNPQVEPQPPASIEAPAGVDAPAIAVDTVAPPPAIPAPAPAPPRDPVWSGWDVLLITGLTILTLIVVELLTVVVAYALFYRHSNFVDVAQKPLLALIGEFLSYIAVAMYMIMLVEGKYHTPFWKAIHWNWPRTATKLSGLAALGVCTIVLDILGNVLLPMPKTTPFDQFFAHPRDAYLIAIFACTFGPLMEELFFRGFLYPVLALRTGTLWAVFLTALPFGLMHYFQYRSWAAVLVVFLVGVVLTVVRAVTNSVAAGFLVHAGYNTTLMVLAALATHGFRHMEKAVLCWP